MFSKDYPPSVFTQDFMKFCDEKEIHLTPLQREVSQVFLDNLNVRQISMFSVPGSGKTQLLTLLEEYLKSVISRKQKIFGVDGAPKGPRNPYI